MSRLVVADTGPLIHLAQADVFRLLELAGEVLVPGAVLDELESGSIDVSELEFVVVQVDIDTESTYPHLDHFSGTPSNWSNLVTQDGSDSFSAGSLPRDHGSHSDR